MTRKPDSIKGHHLPAPKLTKAGYRAAFIHIVLPLLGVLLLLDGLLYLLFRYGFDRCYGALCLL